MRQPVRVLLVDDYAPVREYVRTALRCRTEVRIVSEAADGLEAVQKAQGLKPDLVLLDIGLPTLNGIEAARQIREVSPDSRIIFLTEIRAWSFAEEALRCGGDGYVVKSDAASELLQAVDAVLKGSKFVSSSIARQDTSEPPGLPIERHHEAGFFSDDEWLIQHVTDFVSTNLKLGDSAIVLATEPHRNGILERLASSRHDVTKAIEQGRYIAVDAEEAVAKFMVGRKPDQHRFLSALNGILDRAALASRGGRGRVGIYGECVNVLCAQRNPEAALEMETFAEQLFERYDLHMLCGYSINGLHNVMDGYMFQRFREAHSAVHFH